MSQLARDPLAEVSSSVRAHFAAASSQAGVRSWLKATRQATGGLVELLAVLGCTMESCETVGQAIGDALADIGLELEGR